jgi:hypothetical protein
MLFLQHNLQFRLVIEYSIIPHYIQVVWLVNYGHVILNSIYYSYFTLWFWNFLFLKQTFKSSKFSTIYFWLDDQFILEYFFVWNVFNKHFYEHSVFSVTPIRPKTLFGQWSQNYKLISSDHPTLYRVVNYNEIRHEITYNILSHIRPEFFVSNSFVRH